MLIFLGDVHGEWDNVIRILKRQQITNAEVVQLGDFGIGWEHRNKEFARLGNLNKWLRLKNIRMHVVRGNHDDPDYFDGSVKLSNLELHPDNTRLSIDGEVILLLGGAISVDRIKRNAYNEGKGVGWWPGEKFKLDEELLESMDDVTIVASHGVPTWCPPQTKNNVEYFMRWDTRLETELALERHDFAMAWEALDKNSIVKWWYSGHYHMRTRVQINHTRFRLVDIDELVDHDTEKRYYEIE